MYAKFNLHLFYDEISIFIPIPAIVPISYKF